MVRGLEGEVLGFKCESGLWLRDVALLESKLEGMNTVYVLGALGTADMMGTVDEEYCDLMGSFQDLKECYAFTKAMKVSSLRMESEADGESLGKRARASGLANDVCERPWRGNTCTWRVWGAAAPRWKIFRGRKFPRITRRVGGARTPPHCPQPEFARNRFGFPLSGFVRPWVRQSGLCV